MPKTIIRAKAQNYAIPDNRLTSSLIQDLCALHTADSLESTLLVIAKAAASLAKAPAAICLLPNAAEGLAVAALSTRRGPPGIVRQRLSLDQLSADLFPSSGTVLVEAGDELARALGLSALLGRHAGWEYPLSASPLSRDGRLFAVLLFKTPHLSPVAKHRNKTLTLLLDQAALAIWRARERDDLHRRVNHLGSLLSLDNTLTPTPNYESTVGQIVNQVKQLVDVERVDVVLYDPERDELVWDKAATADNRERPVHASLPVSAQSVTGHVFRTGQPYVSNDLLADGLVLKQWVRINGARQLAAVPLDAGGQRIGVLRVYNKHRGEFTEKDVQLLCLLGAHLGLHFHNARLLEDARRTVAKVTHLKEVVERQQEGLRHVLTVHDELTRMVLDGEGIPTVVTTLGQLLGRPVAVQDRFAGLIAHHTPDGQVAVDWLHRLRSALAQPDEPAVRSALASLERESRPVRLEPVPHLGLDQPCIVAPIVVERVALSYLYVLESHGRLDEVDLMTVERAAVAIALEMMKEKAAAKARHKVRGDFITELLSGRPGAEAALLKRAALLGIDLTVPRAVLVMDVDDVATPAKGQFADEQLLKMNDRLLEVVERACRRTAPGAVVVSRNDEIIVLADVPSDAAGDRQGELANLGDCLRKEVPRWLPGISVSVGIGDRCARIAEYAHSYRRARQALDVVRASRQSDRTVAFDSVGVYGMLLEPHNRDKLIEFVEHTLGKLLRDGRRGAELRETLDHYLCCDCHLERTAEALHIHPNTLRNRLQRIEEITGAELHRLECRVNLELALKALRLLGLQRSDGS